MVELQSGADLQAGPRIDTDDAIVQRKSGVSQRRTAATVHAGTQPAPARAKPNAAPRAAAQATPGAGSYGTGVMLDDNPFNQAFGTSGELPSLEVEGRDDLAPPSPSRSSSPSFAPESLSPPAPEESAAEQRAREIHEIASYGPPPAKLWGAPLYCVRVVLRKRGLLEELAALSAQRKRTDDHAQAALVQLGEAFYGLRGDARLAELSKQLKVVSGADARFGDVQAKDQKRQQSTEQELARIDRELSACEQEAAPLREGEATAEAEIEALKAQVRRVDLQRRKAETELETLLRGKTGADPDRVAALRAERDARHGELQTLGIEMRPLEDGLAAARREVAKRMRAIAVLQGEKQSVVTALDRAQQNHRVSFGSAKDGRAQALTSLANAGLKLGLGELVPEIERAAYDAAQRAHQKRAQEELHRAAAASFDQKAYTHGLVMLLGGSGLLFLTLALLVLV